MASNYIPPLCAKEKVKKVPKHCVICFYFMFIVIRGSIIKRRASVEWFCNKSHIFVTQSYTCYPLNKPFSARGLYHSPNIEIKQQYTLDIIHLVYILVQFVFNWCVAFKVVCTAAQSLCVLPPNWGTDIAVVSLNFPPISLHQPLRRMTGGAQGFRRSSPICSSIHSVLWIQKLPLYFSDLLHLTANRTICEV